MIYSAADNSDSESEDESFDSSSHTSLDSIKGLIIHINNNYKLIIMENIKYIIIN